MSDKVKKGLIIGFLFIIASAIITMAFQHDLAFIFAGFGAIIIGITCLIIINKKGRK